MTHPTDEELDALVARLLDGPSLVYRDIEAGKKAAAAIATLRAQLTDANARSDRAEAALAALEAAPHVNETPKSEHDRADVLSAMPATVAPSLRITGPNSDGEYWLHIKAGGRSGGVNLGGGHGPICKRLLDAASETGAKE